MELLKNFLAIRKTVPEHITICAVSKFKPVEAILELYKETGHSIYGESRAQELVAKMKVLPKAISLHFIGHLQTNKVKIVIPGIRLIQSIDSYRLLKEVDKESARIDKVTDILLQFHIASEETKFGFSPDEAMEMIEDKDFGSLQNINIKGVMGMATLTDNQTLIRKEFRSLRQVFETLKSEYFKSAGSFSEISMGMSDDYKLAIEEGSTMVRIGSLIFGER
jgi:PLP dependent protein